MKTLRLINIEKTYNPGREWAVPALRGISYTFYAGKSYALMGVSGSGKTTLLNVIGGLDFPTNGQCLWDGQDMTGLSDSQRASIRAKQIGFVLQNYGLVEDLSALDNCIAPAIFAGDTMRKARHKAMCAMEQMHIPELARRPVKRMSGGQKQRVAIARALINQPGLLIADEPTGSLDMATADRIAQALLGAVNERCILLIATHNESLAARCDEVLHIQDGLLV